MFWECEKRQEQTARLTAAFAQFDSLFPSESEAVDAFWIMLQDAGVNCPYCHGDRVPIRRGNRVGICIDCRQLSWLTAETFFADAKRLRPWLAVLFLADMKLLPSANQFARFLNIAYATAWEILRKVSMVINSDLELEGTLLRSSTFKSTFTKRSRETVTREHPSSEEEVYESTGASEDCRQSQANKDALNDKKEEEEKEIGPAERLLDLLTSEPTNFETLIKLTNLAPSELSTLLTMLELDGRAVSLDGDCYIRRAERDEGQSRKEALSGKRKFREILPDSSTRGLPQSERLQATFELDQEINSAKEFIGKVHHGISRKYSQHYLALHWFLSNESRWRRGDLFAACLKNVPISRAKILDFVSQRKLFIGRFEVSHAALVEVSV